MPEAIIELKNVVEDIVSSYETRMGSINSIFDFTSLILSDFQEPVLNTKSERERITVQLRDILAKNEHLRRKDFDALMQGILLAQEQREKEVRNSLKQYLNNQKSMAQALRSGLEGVKDSLAKGEAERVREFQALIKKILAEQEERKKEVTFKLKEFQKEQQRMAGELKNLLAKGKELRIRDFKSMLKEFEGRHNQRVSRREERRKEVRSLLGAFKKQRIEAAKTWQPVRKKMAQEVINSPEAVKIDG